MSARSMRGRAISAPGQALGYNRRLNHREK
jgi:hypothetical protein